MGDNARSRVQHRLQRWRAHSGRRGHPLIADEALKEVCTQGSGKDDATLVQRQALKSLTTEGETTRPRTEQVLDNRGQLQYRVANHVQRSNEVRVTSTTTAPGAPCPS